MKTPILVLIVALLLPAMAFAHQPNTDTSPEEKIQRVLDRLIIPKLELRDLSLREALDFLSNQIRKADAQGRGIPFILEINAQASPPPSPAANGQASNPGPGPVLPAPISGAPSGAAPAVAAPAEPIVNPDQVRITVTLANIPTVEALRYVASLAGVKFRAAADGVHIYAASAPRPARQRPFHLSSSLLALSRLPDPALAKIPSEKSLQIWDMLDQLIIPKLELHRASLQEALAVLGHEIRKRSGVGRQIQIAVEPVALPPPEDLSASAPIPGLESPPGSAPIPDAPLAPPAAAINPADPRLTVALAHISLREALRYIANLANVSIALDAHGLDFFRQPAGSYSDVFREPTRMRTFRLSPSFRRRWKKLNYIYDDSSPPRIPDDSNPSRVPGDSNPQLSKEAAFKNLLISEGVTFDWDASVSLNRQATLLTVRNTESQFASIPSILDQAGRGGAVPGPEVPKAVPPLKFIDPAKLEKKIQSITLPKVVLDNVNLEEAAAALGKLSVRYDTRSPRGDHGVNILAIREQPAPVGIDDAGNPVFSEPGPARVEEDPLISYSATNVPLKDAIEEISRLAHRQVSVRASCVIIAKHPPKDAMFTRIYLLPPNSLKESKQPSSHDPIWEDPQFITQKPPTEKAPSAIYLPGSGRLIVFNTEAEQKTIQDVVEASWRNYYAAEKARKRNHR